MPRTIRAGEIICPGNSNPASGDTGDGLASIGGFRGGGGRSRPAFAPTCGCIDADAPVLGLTAGFGGGADLMAPAAVVAAGGSWRRVGGDVSGLRDGGAGGALAEEACGGLDGGFGGADGLTVGGAGSCTALVGGFDVGLGGGTRGRRDNTGLAVTAGSELDS